MTDGDDQTLVALLLIGLMVWGMVWLARQGAKGRPPASRKGLTGPRNLSYVPMRAADAAKARQASIWTGRVNGGLTAREWEAGRTLPTRRGDLVRSQAEVRIANALLERGLRYEYEPMVCGFRPDFFLPDHGVVIEYWGMDGKDYAQRRRTKTRAYLQAGYALVSLGPGKGISVEEDLRRQLWYKLEAR